MLLKTFLVIPLLKTFLVILLLKTCLEIKENLDYSIRRKMTVRTDLQCLIKNKTSLTKKVQVQTDKDMILKIKMLNHKLNQEKYFTIIKKQTNLPKQKHQNLS